MRMKPFKLGDKSWRKAQVTAKLDERWYTVETDGGAVYRRNRQHLRKTSEPPAEPIITKPEPHMARATTTTATATTTTTAATPPRAVLIMSHTLRR